MSNHNDHDKERSPAIDLEALSRAYEQSLRDVSFGGKSVPIPSNEKSRQKPAPTGELKDFTPKASSRESEDTDEHDKIVRKIRQNRKKFSHSVWTDEPILKPKKSVWIDDSTAQFDRNEVRQEAARQEALRQQTAAQKKTIPDQASKPSAPKKSEPLILAMAEPARNDEQAARGRPPMDARNERQEARQYDEPSARRRPRQGYDEPPIRPILNEKPKKQELVMRMDGHGASRVREIPRQPNKKQVTMRMSPEAYEEYRRNGINSDNSVRRTVSINMPISKILPEEEEKQEAQDKQEVRREDLPKASAKDIVDDIANKIGVKQTVTSAKKETEDEVTAMSLDEIIRETQAQAELRQAEEKLEKNKAEASEAAEETSENTQASAEEEASAEREAHDKAGEKAEDTAEKASLKKTEDTEADTEAPKGVIADEKFDDDSEDKSGKSAEETADNTEEVHEASDEQDADESEEASEESTDSADSSQDTADDGEVYNFTGLINKVKSQRAKPALSEDESTPGVEEEPEPTAELPIEEITAYSAEAEKKHSKRRKKPKYHEGEFGFINSAMCLGLVFTIFLSLLLMKRESGFISSENRDLAVMPKFSGEGYVSGEFAKDVTTYFTDTVPGRETFKKFGAVFRSNLGINLDDTVVTGNHKVAEKEEADKDKLATTTTVTVNTDIKETTDDKDNDSSAETSKKTTKKSKTSEEVVDLPDVLDDGQWEGDVIVFGKDKDIRAVAGYYGLFGTGTLYAETINKWKEELGDVNVYNMSIPTASAYYLPDSFKDTVSSQKDNIDNIASELRGIVNVDVYDELNRHKDEYIYSRTDHHWQPLGAYYAGRVFAEKAGIFYPDINSYEKYKIDGFLGTMYAYSNYDTRLADNPDTFTYYKPGNDYTVRYYDTEFKNPLESTLFFDNAEGVNCYSAVLGRDEEITEIETDCTNSRVLVIFKDSYGNVLAPFFTQSFEKIYVCDFRYFDLNAIDFCKSVGCTDLLFAISLTSCSTEMHITAINNDRIQLDPDTLATSETTTLYVFDPPEEDGENADGGDGNADDPVYGANDNAQFGENNYPNGY